MRREDKTNMVLKGMKTYMNINILQNLKDAGCKEDMIQKYSSKTSSREQLSVLEFYREGLLDEIHVLQKRLDCLDYLIFQLRKTI